MNIRTLLAALALASPGGALAALAAPPVDEEEQAEEQPEESAPETDEPLSLDDLLNIPDEDRPIDRPADDPGAALDALDPNKPELERKLTATEITESFRQAVVQMRDAADRLELAGDVGVSTQRIQEEIITRLEKLIEQAEQQSSSSSSSSSSQSKQQQQQQKSSQQPRKGEQEGQQESEKPGAQAGEAPSGSQQGDLPDVLDAARAAWGALPTRVRDTLLQGVGEARSDIYRAMTEEYYRRLAEDRPNP